LVCSGKEGTADLLSCRSCRAAYHPGCLGLDRPTDTTTWQCLECRNDKPAVKLVKWSLELFRQPSGRVVPLVRGIRSDVDAPPDSLWRTAEIVHAVSATVLVTRTRMMVTLSGKMSKTLARKLKLPNSLIQRFQGGFPTKSWMALIRYCDQEAPLGISKAIAGSSPCLAPVVLGSVDWTKGLKSMPDSDSRLRSRPILHPDEGAALLVATLLRRDVDEHGIALPTPILIGAPARRYFSDRGFSCKVAATGLDSGGSPSALLSYKDGTWEILSEQKIGELRQQLYLVGSQRLGTQKKHMASSLPLSKRQLETSHADDVSVIQQAMRAVRPSAKHFWDEVATRVGKTAEECQAVANSIGSPGPAKRRRLESSPAKIKDDEANANPLPEVLANLPQKDGPARAKKVQAIMSTRCFRDSHDFLDLGTSEAQTSPQELDGFTSPQRIPGTCPDQSPSSLRYLSGLHTGCTPTRAKKEFVSRRLFGESPHANSWCLANGSSPCCSDDDGEDPVWNALHDVGNVSWQPKGIEGFICQTRARRGRLAKKSNFRAAPRAPSEAELRHQQQLRRAPALFRRVDAQFAQEAAMECAAPSCSEDSEDEMAPIAYVPPCP